MIILFCNHPLAPREVDPDYLEEWEAAGRHGFGRSLVSFEDLTAGLPLRRLPAEGVCLYRGWMLKPEHYDRLYQALDGRLLTTPEQYRFGHLFPNSYLHLEGFTPESVWSDRPDRFESLLAGFGQDPVIIKDYVKSRKHEWLEACYIPRADQGAAVVRTFVERQGEDLVGGLVVRRFEAFEQVGVHPQSGLPTFREYRLFFADGRLVMSFPYWGEKLEGPEPPSEPFASLAARLPAR
ncbi:MAG: ATP-grasp domain-containing protein, partial [Candidatus Eremiobacteraeota bacterium]|nr:ATP-grasp domain-containing protein [Candidatus Eremiobacteraeota bacterium]